MGLLVTTGWMGGSRVTISRDGDTAKIKLLCTRMKRGRSGYMGYCETTASITTEFPISKTSEILASALKIAKYGKCNWVWDSCDIGVAELYNTPSPEQNPLPNELIPF